MHRNLVILLALAILAAGSVYAGCCPTTCADVSAGCAAYEPATSCVDLPQCGYGCCCPTSSNSGVVKQGVSCSTDNFVTGSYTSADVNNVCSCSGASYTVSGTITQSGTPVAGATVSAGGKSTTSSSNPLGSYTLTAVPSGTVTVNALVSSTGCTGSASVNLNSDKTVDIDLTCTCAEGECNAFTNSICTDIGTWQTFNLGQSTQKQQYCAKCAAQDPGDCSGVVVCIGNDGACNPQCSASSGDANYDSDCVCDNSRRNGVCPVNCDYSNDLDCSGSVSSSCGDSIVFYPFETCEPNPYPDQISLCSGSSCTSCNCVGLLGCGNGVLDSNEQCELGMVCADGSTCLGCKCGQSCTGANLNPTVSLSFDSTARSVNVLWSLNDACKSIVGSYVVYSCKKVAGETCANKASFSPQGTFDKSKTSMNVVVEQNSDYAFYVDAYYINGGVGSSTIKSIKTGTAFCMDLLDKSSQFCWDNKRSRCDANNNIVTVEDCGAARFCMGPDGAGMTYCDDQGVCDLCNGLYGVFANLDLRVSVNGNLKYCYALPGVNRDVVSGCYLDSTQTLFSAFQYCNQVTSCYDFKSEYACTDANDPCSKNQGCVWSNLDDAKPELGGICKPANVLLQNCQYCSDSKYNWLSSVCTPAICSLFGQCFYAGLTAPEPCTNRIIKGCSNYKDQSECEGSRAVSVDVDYDASFKRVGGTHDVTKSLDSLGLGKCYWDEVNDRCWRDADNLKVVFSSGGGALRGMDCPVGDIYCDADFSEPVTNILPSSLGVYPANPAIRYTVTDNYPPSKIETYFCVSSGSCYPNQRAGNNSYIASITTSGSYYVYYYSMDFAKNLEKVKRMRIDVDAVPPFIDIMSPEDVSSVITNQANLQLTLRTSQDAKWVCANNSVTRKTSCINSCALTSGVQPCFDEEWGIFDMNVTVSGGTTNAARDVVFYTEDYAGNKYQNTLYGIIYDITPPTAPVITVD